MTPFEHLGVLVSIVIGLGIAHLLSALHRVVEARDRVRGYWLVWLWAAVIFVAQIEWWWAFFELRHATTWNFFYFLFVLLSPVTLFLASTFALPDVEKGDRYDLREHYYATRGWFFGMVAAGPALDAVRRALQAGSWTDFGAVSNAVSAVALTSLAVSRRPALHAVVSLAVVGLFLFFIVSQAIRLR